MECDVVPFDTLTDFIAGAEDAGELFRISDPVDSRYEIAEVTKQVCQQTDGGPIVFFENVLAGDGQSHSIPVVSNILGTEKRVSQIFNAGSLEEPARRLIQQLIPDYPGNWVEVLEMIPKLSALQKIPPRTVSRGICQQVVRLGRDVDLGALPIPHHWSCEPSPTITRAHVVAMGLRDGVCSVSAELIGLVDKERLVIHWDEQSSLAACWEEACSQGQQLPVAIVLGGDPILDVVAKAKLPQSIDKYLLAGLLRQLPLELVGCRTQPLEVPSHAEFVIEGFLDPHAELMQSGPIVLPTGCASEIKQRPVISVTGITHRTNPLFPTQVYASSPMEDGAIGKLLERFFFHVLRLHQPEILDIHSPVESECRDVLFVRLKKSYAHHAQKVMFGIWGFGFPLDSKMIVVVDADVNIRDSRQVWNAIGQRVHPQRDLTITSGPAMMAEQASPIVGAGGRLGIDATRKRADEGHPRRSFMEAESSLEVIEKVKNMLREMTR